MQLEIRPLKSSREIQLVSDLADGVYPNELYEPTETFHSIFEAYPSGANGLFLDSVLIGYAFYFPWTSSEIFPIGGRLDPQKSTEPGVVYLHDVAIAKEHRGKGFGTVLAKEIFSNLKKDFKYAHGVSVLGSLDFWSRFKFRRQQAINYNGVNAFWIYKVLID